MDSLDHAGRHECAEIPRFDDGMVNIQELIRIMAESLVNEIMDAQAEDACADGNRRNGYRERALVTSVGDDKPAHPQAAAGEATSRRACSLRYSRVDQGRCRRGIGNGDLRRFHEEGGARGRVPGHRPHERLARCRGYASLLTMSWPTCRSGTCPAHRVPLYLGRRHLRQVPRRRPRVLMRARHGDRRGRRRLPAPARPGRRSTPSPTPGGWRFCAPCRERGASGVLCVTSDAHEGLRRAIEEVFPGAAWQRCIVHLMRNAASCAPTQAEEGGGAGDSARGLRRAGPGARARAVPSGLRGDRRHMPEGGRAARGCRGGRPGLPGLPLCAPQAASAPTTSRSGQTASSSAAAAWCRSSRPGNR